MSFLDAQSRATLFEPPETDEEALARYALSVEDIAFAKGHRRPHNRLGFAIQLALVRDLGRPLRMGEAPPQAIISAVADQLGIDVAVFASMRNVRKHAGNMRARSLPLLDCELSGRAITVS